MSGIWQVLVEFILRITFGVALAMAATSPKQVNSGFFRVHLWVLMGLNTFASLILFSLKGEFADAPIAHRIALVMAIGLAALSYVGAVVWLYEKARLGRVLLAIIVTCAFSAGAAIAVSRQVGADAARTALPMTLADFVAGSCLMGTILSSMFLGHWYLNHPEMDMRPLRRLLMLLFAAVALRAAVSSGGLAMQAGTDLPQPMTFWTLLTLRWGAGLAGVAAMGWMAWQTLKIPNTQSATGILYAGVILAFLGELVSQLLSSGLAFPV